MLKCWYAGGITKAWTALSVQVRAFFASPCQQRECQVSGFHSSEKLSLHFCLTDLNRLKSGGTSACSRALNGRQRTATRMLLTCELQFVVCSFSVVLDVPLQHPYIHRHTHLDLRIYILCSECTATEVYFAIECHMMSRKISWSDARSLERSDRCRTKHATNTIERDCHGPWHGPFTRQTSKSGLRITCHSSCMRWRQLVRPTSH